MRTLAAAAAVAAILGTALLAATDGAATLGWGLVDNVSTALALVGAGAVLARRGSAHRMGVLLLFCGTPMALNLLAADTPPPVRATAGRASPSPSGCRTGCGR